MAHASTREVAVLQMKKVRKLRDKRKLEDAKLKQELSEEEYDALKKKRYEKSLRERCQTALWDYKQRQYAIGRYEELRNLLKARRKEIKDNDEQYAKKELEQIEGVLNELQR